jgi:hypothetical protein
MSLIVDGTTGVTFNDSSLQGAAASPFGLKNRIINGAMVVDQRNAGASVTPTANAYTLDRWTATLTQASKFSVQQNAGSVTPPTGFTNYLGITSTSAYSVVSSDVFTIRQSIEGFNTSDLDFGKSTAKTITLSFWVRSSLTGTFGGSLKNSAADRSYPFTYTISSANTWEYKTITVAGDTTGTWLVTNGTGLIVSFGLGVGSTFNGTAGAWAASNFNSATGATSVVGTNGATFYITGVQLEIGTSATPFERRLYGQELALCQRYYYRNKAIATGNRFGSLFCETTTLAQCIIPFPVSMRTNPTALEQSGTAGDYTVFAGGAVTTCNSVPVIGNATTEACNTVFSVASGLTIGHGGAARAANTNAYLGFSAEL